MPTVFGEKPLRGSSWSHSFESKNKKTFNKKCFIEFKEVRPSPHLEFLCFTKSRPIDYGYFILRIQAQHFLRTALQLLQNETQKLIIF